MQNTPKDPTAFHNLNNLLVKCLHDPSLTKPLYSSLLQHRLDFKSIKQSFTPFDGQVVLNGKVQQVSEEYRKGVSVISKLLELSGPSASLLFDHALTVRKQFGDCSITECCIYLYSMEVEQMLDCIDILLRFSNSRLQQDPFATLNWFMDELFNDDVLVLNLIKVLEVNFKVLEALTPLPNDSTTQKKDELMKAGVTEQEINVYMDRLGREINMITLVLLRIGERIEEYVYILKRIAALHWTREKSLEGVLLMSFLTSINGYTKQKHIIYRQRFLLEDSVYKEINQCINGSWSNDSLQAVCSLQWLCCLETISNAPSQNPQLRNTLATDLVSLKKKWTEKYCYQPLVYKFLGNYVKGWKNLFAATDSIEQDPVSKDIFSLSLTSIEGLVTFFIGYFKKHFRLMLSKDQDAASAWEEKQKLEKLQGHIVSSNNELETAWESLLGFIYELYVGREDAAVSWWTEPELAQFIRLSADVWTPRFLILFLHVLSALSTGVNSANHAHNVLNMEHSGSLGQVTWSTFFRTLNSYVERLSPADNVIELSPPEIGLIIAFLELLTQVATYSYTSRRVLCENQDFRALDTLFFLLVTRIPIELKSALLRSISAFCAPPFNSIDIANHIWNFIEQSQIVPIDNVLYQENAMGRKANLDAQMQNRGILYDMREIESNIHSYPETLALLKLFKNLIISSENRGPQSVFESLGLPNRPGGIRAYISFIIDEIFLKLDERQYQNETEKVELTQFCLEIFLLCLESFDMSFAINSLMDQKVSQTNTIVPGTSTLNPLRSLGLHPGFEILTRLLAGTKLTEQVFSIVVADAKAKGVACIILTSLRILHRGLQLHKAFLEVVSPALVQAKEATSLLLPSAMSGLDALLATKHNVVLQLASNINSESESICLLSLQLLFLLSQSTIFATVEQSYNLKPSNRLAGVIEGSPKSKQIVQGFVDRLRAESVEGKRKDVNRIPNHSVFVSEEWDHSESHNIKIAILELIIWNLSSKTYPNIGFFLLGLHARSEGNHENLEQSCLPVIAELLCNSGGDSLALTQPIFVEHCFHLIYMVLSNHLTSNRVLRYLRNEHDFFIKQLINFETFRDDVETINDSTISRVYQCGWLLQILALELHVTSHSGQRSQSQELVGLLFGVMSLNGLRNSEHLLMQEQQRLDQSVTKVIEFLGHLNFVDDFLPAINLGQTCFEDLNLADFMAHDSRGSEIFDVQSLHDLMYSFVDSVETGGILNQYGGRVVVVEQIQAIVTHLLDKNNNQRMVSARFHTAKAWMYLVRIAVSEYFDLIPFEVRERRIFELLSNLLQKVNKSGVSLPISTCASQTALALASRLKEDKHMFRLINSTSGSSLQSDSFHSLILKGILDGIQVPGSTTVMRGNYYSTLSTFLNYAMPSGSIRSKGIVRRNGQEEAYLEMIALVYKQPNRFWDLLCRDATDAELVWRSVSFSTLATLCHLGSWLKVSADSTNSHPLMNFLTKRNYLGHYIQTIKESDPIYFEILNSANTEHENSRYVFETKMAFLLRFASSKVGADRLVDYGVFEVFSECRYLDQLPKDTFSSEVTLFDDQSYDKYYALINPVFELILAVLSHFDISQVTVMKKLVNFLTAHQGTLIAILRKGIEDMSLSSLYQIKLITGMFAWLGASNELAHQVFPGPGQNTFSFALIDVLTKISSNQWYPKLKPVTDIEVARAAAINPFSIGGSRRSVFLEEAIHIANCVCRNILVFCRKVDNSSYTVSIDGSVFIGLITDSADRLNHIILEEQNLQSKIGDLAQVSAEEINESTKFFFPKIFHELSLTQRQELFRGKLVETTKYMREKIHILYEIVELSAVGLTGSAYGSQGKLKVGFIAEMIEKLLFSITNRLLSDKDAQLLNVANKILTKK